MTVLFDYSSKVGDIVAEFPQASDVFKKAKVDFCCGGNRPIGEVITERKLEDTQLLEQINQLYEQFSFKEDTDWRKASSSEIIKHIIHTHHAFLREEFKSLTPYVKKVTIVHGEKHPFLLQVNPLFFELQKELLEHTDKEEKLSFPAILSFESFKTDNAAVELKNLIMELEAEHDRSGAILKEIREITKDYTVPEDACRTFQLVFRRLEDLEADTFQHIHLENNILFPRYYL